MKNIIIIGAGGHGKVIADLVLKTGNVLIGFLDDNPSLKTVMRYPVLGSVSDINKYKNNTEFTIGIGNNQIRQHIAEKYEVQWCTLIHPTASIGVDVFMGKGTVVMAGAVINAAAIIGQHCIINSGAIVEHDCRLDNYIHISPNAALGGNVFVGQLTQIGLGATVRNNIVVCAECLIGAGAVVVHDIVEKGIYVGVPIKKLKPNDKCIGTA